jgi:pimeloyl-ACP methyl ester carboxylesterase
MSRKITEQVVLLGGRNTSVGILTRAVAEPTDRLAIVFLNTGIIHRVGYHRMFVAMSRAFATAGYPALRFDFSGIGDSEPRQDALSPLEACMADIGDALDWLERTHQISRVVLIGLCSGADHAVQYGHTDARVVGLVLLDPTIPTTARHVVHYVALRLTDPRSWARFFTGRSRVIRIWSRPGSASRREPLPGAGPPLPIEHHYRLSVANGIAMLAAFTGESTRQTYREQMIDAFPTVAFGDLLKLEFFDDSDHVFSRQIDRMRLNQLILDWIGFADSRTRRHPSAAELAP